MNLRLRWVTSTNGNSPARPLWIGSRPSLPPINIPNPLPRRRLFIATSTPRAVALVERETDVTDLQTAVQSAPVTSAIGIDLGQFAGDPFT